MDTGRRARPAHRVHQALQAPRVHPAHPTAIKNFMTQLADSSKDVYKVFLLYRLLFRFSQRNTFLITICGLFVIQFHRKTIGL